MTSQTNTVHAKSLYDLSCTLSGCMSELKFAGKQGVASRTKSQIMRVFAESLSSVSSKYAVAKALNPEWKGLGGIGRVELRLQAALSGELTRAELRNEARSIAGDIEDARYFVGSAYEDARAAERRE
jgi:hypothetical protein